MYLSEQTICRWSTTSTTREHQGQAVHVIYSAAFAVGSPSLAEPEGNVLTRHPDRSCRSPVPPASPSGRMETSPRGCTSHLAQIWQGRSGSFCLPGNDTLCPLVFFQGTKSPRPRCSGTRMGQATAICFPASAVNIANTGQGVCSKTRDTANSPQMARKSMVSSVIPTFVRQRHGLQPAHLLYSTAGMGIWRPAGRMRPSGRICAAREFIYKNVYSLLLVFQSSFEPDPNCN